MVGRPVRQLVLAALAGTLLNAASAAAQDRPGEIEALRETIERLERRIEALEREKTKEEAASALDEAVRELDDDPTPSKRPLASYGRGGVTAQLLDLSIDVLSAVGGSTEDGESLRRLQAGDHDPRKNGFTLQALELSGLGAVDPYVSGEAHILFFLDPDDGETIVELEEAFLTTQSLPYGLEVEAGHFFTEFGRSNPMHPHAWNWLDQPMMNSRVFGADGMRNPGARLGWLLPLPWFSELHVGVQNPDGETMPSFLGGSLEHAHGEEDEAEHDDDFEEGIAGRPIVNQNVDDPTDMVALARWVNGLDLADTLSTQFGFSFLTGSNVTGENARTRVYGGDAVFKWRPAQNFRGWPFFLWENELIVRQYEADAFADPDEPREPLLAEDTLWDWGVRTQGLFGFHRPWAAGLRFEYASGDGESVGGRERDPFRSDRIRLSPLLVWQPTEFSRFRLQYGFDDADHLDDGQAHTVWFGFEFLIGSHPAHTY